MTRTLTLLAAAPIAMAGEASAHGGSRASASLNTAVSLLNRTRVHHGRALRCSGNSVKRR